MAQEDGAISTPKNTAAGGGIQVLKKGPWTAAEDAMLMEYVKTQGEGNWNAVQRNSGLMRCGKSCRLRWANHLRPNLRKGAFTPEEERRILELHSKLGNKWARMALHLPGRTDNEIKNYWNTRLKRCLRAGLPIYPVDFQHHHRRPHEQSLQHQTIPLSSSSSSSNPLLFDPLNYHVMNTPCYLQNSQSNFKILCSNTRFLKRAFPSPLQSNHAMIQIPKLEPINPLFDNVRLFENIENELPSIESSLFQPITPTCFSDTANDHTITQLNDGDNAISPYRCHRDNRGLLEDVLGESRSLIRPQIHSNECKSFETDKGKAKIVDEYPLVEEEPENVTLESVFEAQDTNKMALEESSSDRSSIEIGVKSESDVFDEKIVMDDDFTSWLNFPNDKPVDISNGYMNQVEISGSPVATMEMDHDNDHGVLLLGQHGWV